MGEAAVVDRPQGVDGIAWWFLDTLVIEHRRAAGMQSVVLEMTLPVGHAPALHIHENLDDTWYVVEGQMAVRCGDDELVGGAGHWVSMPRGVPHTFRVVGDQPARILTVHDNATFRDFVRELGIDEFGDALPGDGAEADASGGGQAADAGDFGQHRFERGREGLAFEPGIVGSAAGAGGKGERDEQEEGARRGADHEVIPCPKGFEMAILIDAAHSSSGLGHRPLKAEIRGSNPLCATTTEASQPGGLVSLVTTSHRALASGSRSRSETSYSLATKGTAGSCWPWVSGT